MLKIFLINSLTAEILDIYHTFSVPAQQQHTATISQIFKETEQE